MAGRGILESYCMVLAHFITFSICLLPPWLDKCNTRSVSFSSNSGSSFIKLLTCLQNCKQRVISWIRALSLKPIRPYTPIRLIHTLTYSLLLWLNVMRLHWNCLLNSISENYQNPQDTAIGACPSGNYSLNVDHFQCFNQKPLLLFSLCPLFCVGVTLTRSPRRSLESTPQSKLWMILSQPYPCPNAAKLSTMLVRLRRSKVRKRQRGWQRVKARGRESRLKRETTWRRTQEHSVLINFFLH